MSRRVAARFEPTFEGWRDEARRALCADLSPEEVVWEPAGAVQAGLFSLPGVADASGPAPRVPRRVLSLLRNTVAFDAPDRWDVAYRVLRTVAGQGEAALNDVGIPWIRTALARDKAIRRDVHKMHAFVRFQRRQDEQGEHWVSWHRPDHYVVRLAAPHFAKRFGDMRFALLTPEGSAVHTPGQGLAWAAATAVNDVHTPDELDALWCTYYANIYNPARTMLDAMRAEMPPQHWATMPETRLIPQLLADASRRLAEAAARAPAGPSDLLPSADAPFEALQDAVRACAACPLAGPATQAVCGQGPTNARIVLVGEQEDRVGRPFVGPAGQVLNDALAAAGIAHDDVYRTNTVKHLHHRKRGKHRLHERPERWHVEHCAPFVFEELRRIQPEVVVALGATAARALLGRATSLASLYGEPHRGRHGLTVRVAPHPAAILRQPHNPGLRETLVQTLRACAEEPESAAG